MEGGVQRARLDMGVGDLRNRPDLFQIRVGQDRLAHFEALGAGDALQIEQVRPRPDDGDEAHHQLFVDRVDRRIGDLREVLLEIGEQRLRLVDSAEIGVSLPIEPLASSPVDAIGVIRMLMSSWPVAERLLPIEQRQVRAHAFGWRIRQFLQHDLGAVQPFAIGMHAAPVTP